MHSPSFFAAQATTMSSAFVYLDALVGMPLVDIDVSAYIDQLRRSLPYVPPFLNGQIKALHRKRDFGGIVRLVRIMMNIDARITLHWTSDPASNRQAPAWIRLPKHIPTYGTQEFKDLKLDMFILKSFAHQSRCHEFIVVVAHEFSHVVLESIEHPLRADEKAVDLTAMLLGFSYSYRLAAHAERAYLGNIVETSRLGYQDELDAACRILLPQNLRLRHLAISFLRVGWGLVILLGMCIGAWLLGELNH